VVDKSPFITSVRHKRHFSDVQKKLTRKVRSCNAITAVLLCDGPALAYDDITCFVFFLSPIIKPELQTLVVGAYSCLVVEYRTRNSEVAGSTLTRSKQP